jgi:cold shock CspA family protein
VARVLQSPAIMIMVEPAEHEILGRIAYVDPSRQWGYLHGPYGERVYFHAADVMHAITDLAPGAQVCYRTIDRDRQPSAVQIVRCERRP